MIVKTLIDDFSGFPLRVMGSVGAYTLIGFMLGVYGFGMSVSLETLFAILIGMLMLKLIAGVLSGLIK